MPDQIDTLRLGNFVFSGFSPPDLLPVGGKQHMQVHKLPGGARVIDTMGPDDDDIAWHGTFFQNDAIDVCVQLDAMRRAGQLITLSFAGQSKQVVIGSFIYSIRRFPMWVEYVISCVVYQHPPSTTASGASAVDQSAANDAANGNDVANNTGNDVWQTGAPPIQGLPGGTGTITGVPAPSVTIGTPQITGGG